jgi:hypothetical protein
MAQGVVGDMLAGKLVDPEVGQWAWYDLSSAKDSKKFVVRQAIVGEEKVARRSGYWVEFEIVPEVGYRVVYKMLLTGPASDPRNIVRVIEKTGPEPAVELNVADAGETDSAAKSKSTRNLVGEESVTTLDGAISAEHYKVQQGVQMMDVWINDAIKPTGIVKLESLDGRMVLRNHGVGGEYAKSVIIEQPISAEEAAKNRAAQPIPGPEVETRTNVESGSESGN